MRPATLKRAANWTDGQVPDQVTGQEGMKGFAVYRPTVGTSFLLVYPTADGTTGVFATSEVCAVEDHGGKYVFRTKNSVYVLELDD